jgi:hypothetical protein
MTSPPYRKHKCISHHLRAIAEAEALPGQQKPEYLQDWRRFFKGVLALYRLRGVVSDEPFLRLRGVMEQWRDRDCWQILASLGVSCQQQAKDFLQYLASHLALAPAPG